MGRPLAILLLLATTHISAAHADVSVPIFEIQGYLRTRELFELLNRDVSPTYAGNLSLCKGATASISLQKLWILPSTWFLAADARYGIDLSWKANANVDFRSHQQFCGFRGPVVCASRVQMLGFLNDTMPPIGQCTVPNFGAASIGFDVFHAPALFSSGIPVQLPDCRTSSGRESCVRWVTATNSGYEDDPAQTREVRLATRLFGYADAGDSSRNGDRQHLHNLTFNAHAGANAAILGSRETQARTLAALQMHPADVSSDFAVRVSLDVLDDVFDAGGAIVDRGIFSQLLPVRVYGFDHMPIVGDFAYSFVIDRVAMMRGTEHGKPVRILEMNVFDPDVQSRDSKRQIRLFKQLRIRAVIERVDASVDGALSLRVHNVTIKVVRLFGLFDITFGGPLISEQVQSFLESIKIAKINTTVDVSFPKCVVIEGTHSAEALNNCSEPGLLRHVDGVRGIRAHLEQNTMTIINGVDYAYVAGKTTLTELHVAD